MLHSSYFVVVVVVVLSSMLKNVPWDYFQKVTLDVLSESEINPEGRMRQTARGEKYGCLCAVPFLSLFVRHKDCYGPD